MSWYWSESAKNFLDPEATAFLAYVDSTRRQRHPCAYVDCGGEVYTVLATPESQRSLSATSDPMRLLSGGGLVSAAGDWSPFAAQQRPGRRGQENGRARQRLSGRGGIGPVGFQIQNPRGKVTNVFGHLVDSFVQFPRAEGRRGTQGRTGIRGHRTRGARGPNRTIQFALLRASTCRNIRVP